MVFDMCDCKGTPVKIGAKVKLLSIPECLLSSVPKGEAAHLKSMIGEVFRVYEIDEWGGVWVEKCFDDKKDDGIMSHSLSLTSHEMEVIE